MSTKFNLDIDCESNHLEHQNTNLSAESLLYIYITSYVQ